MSEREYSMDTENPDPDVEWVMTRAGNLWTRWSEYTDLGLTEYRGIVGERAVGDGYWWQIWRDGDDSPMFWGTALDEEVAMSACEFHYEYWLAP